MLNFLRSQVLNSLVCSSILFLGAEANAHNENLEELIEETQSLRTEYGFLSVRVKASIEAWKKNAEQDVKKIEEESGVLEAKLALLVAPSLKLRHRGIKASLVVIRGHLEEMDNQLKNAEKATSKGASDLNDADNLILEWDAQEREFFLAKPRDEEPTSGKSMDKYKVTDRVPDKERDKPFKKRSEKIRSSLRQAIKNLEEAEQAAQVALGEIGTLSRRVKSSLASLTKDIRVLGFVHVRRSTLGDIRVTLPPIQDNKRRHSLRS